MLVLHAAKFANGNTLAFQLQLLFALGVRLARLQALGGVLMRLRHDTVTRNVFFGRFVQLCC